MKDFLYIENCFLYFGSFSWLWEWERVDVILMYVFVISCKMIVFGWNFIW